MESIKTLLLDDEYLALNLLENYVRQVEQLVVVGKYKSPVQALDVLRTGEVDLLFLDIQMPGLSGLQLLSTLQRPPVTIFTTAYSEHALTAFNLNAVDYLLKPFSFERFLQAVNKARTLLLPPAVKVDAYQAHKDFFSIKADGKLIKVAFDDILYIEGLKEYVRIVCRDGRHVTLESLKNLEESILPAEFFLRVHKSYIVAKDKVQSVEGNVLHIGAHKIPISRERRDEVVATVFMI
ncbi:MAG: response regulator transcription factor [Saprospiraceae bacterium]|nr:response regulator transcription factor [Saprospiraceae bacterium]